MKKKIKKYLVLLAAVMGVLVSSGITVSAYTGPETPDTEGFPLMEESAGTEGETGTGELPDTEKSTDAKKAADKKTQSGTGGTSFSVPGNGQLVDELSDDGTKQFLTIQTKNGNTYFMVLDHSSHTENVYMLSMIDEDDLAEFTKDGGEPEPEEPAVLIPETENPPVPAESEPEPEQKPEEAAGGMDKGRLLVIAVLLLGITGAGYYFKVLKPKKDGDEEESEDLEFYDGGAYINEDKEGPYDDGGEDE